MTQPVDKEALRQQMLLRALLGDARPGVVAGWMRESSEAGTRRFERGLAAYRTNAGALAERALAAAFPTLQQLMGEESFAALARHFWQRQPPLAGDIAQWGEGLPAFVADAPTLAEEPYLADVARVDWAVHVAERAADRVTGAAAGGVEVAGLELLGTFDPTQLRLEPQPGMAVVRSLYPVVAIWHAHRPSAQASGDDRFAGVRAAFAAGEGQHALVFRQGWAPRVVAVSAAEAGFNEALLAGSTLAVALHRSGEGLDFEAWLIAALQHRWLAAVTACDDPVDPVTLPSAGS
ncbi:MAG TPA: DNA-binding domain-containing protein [Rubrivivax sp.]|nr:DNA-binding domain-containing protein [Rubrivivax sp.]